MVLKRELVLGTKWTDREGDCAVVMSSLGAALLPLSHTPSVARGAWEGL